MSTIREKIIEYLENNTRKTIREIAKAIQENEASVRTKIYGKKYGLITKGQIVKVSHEKRMWFFSLAKDDLILKKICAEFGIKDYNNMKKPELFDSIINYIKNEKEKYINGAGNNGK